MTLSMRSLRDYKVPNGALTIWWLGQAGFIIKSPKDTLTVIDPYLSDSCASLGAEAGLDFRRLTPPPIAPEELVGVDLFVLTHSHEDHRDPETIKHYRAAGGNGPYLAPAETAEKLEKMGIPNDQIVRTWPNKIHAVGDLSFRATFAVPFTGDDLTHVGYLVSVEDGPTLYITGDTAYHEVLGITIAEHKPDVMLTVINEFCRNMGPADAARLANQIQPKVVIPYHYGLFNDGQMIPKVLKNNMLLYGMQERFRVLQSGQCYTFPES